MPQAAKPRPESRRDVANAIDDLKRILKDLDDRMTTVLNLSKDSRAAEALRGAKRSLLDLVEDIHDTLAMDDAEKGLGRPIPWEEAKAKLGLK